MTLRWRLIAGGLTLSMLSGCGGPTVDPPTTLTEQTSPGGLELPARPRTLDLSRTNPCALITDVQRRTLGVGAGSLQQSSESAPIRSASYCGWSNRPTRPQYEYTGGLTDNTGAEYAIGLEPLRSVQGFAATTSKAMGTDPRWYCGMLVDVAPGSALQVTFENPYRDAPGMTHELACDKAQALADAMLTTFQSMPR